MNSWTTRRWYAGGAAMAMLAAGTLVFDGSAPSTAADEPAPLSLRSISKTADGWKYGKAAYLDLGIKAVAGNDPFEIRAKRPSYDEPVAAYWQGPDGNVRLPTDAVANFDGLRDFYQLTMKNEDGKTVVSRTFDWCPNGETVRARPDAPATSPYPWGCGGQMPFALGAVWGVQAGHALGVPAEYEGIRVRVPVGRYQAKLQITKKYRDTIGIPESAATEKVKVRIREECPDCRSQHQEHSEHSGHSEHHATSEHDNVVPPGERPTGPTRIPEAGPKPDLRSVPAWGIKMSRGKFLTFSATVWNAGDSPLMVDGFRHKDEPLMDAYQYFFNAAGEQVGYDKVGTMEWDARVNHNHWHFTDFARYRLLDADKQSVYRSKKEAFCLANTDAIDYTVDGANWQPDNTDLHTACGEQGSVGLREVLDSGSGDTYAQFRPGQSFVLKDLPNGTYFIEVRANPVRNLVESDTSNNVSYRKVIIGGTSDKRTVKVPSVGLIDHR